MSANRFSTAGLDNAGPKPSAVDPPDANLSIEWNDTLGKLGFTVVVIQMARCEKTFASTEFIESLGKEMSSVELGHHDASQWQPHIRHFFYADAKRLGEALNFLKSGLERSGLLEHSAIGHFDATEKIWRRFHPGIET